jgi:hypothetical protein
MNKSSVQTFLALRKGHETLDCFKLTPKTYTQEFKNQTQIFAQQLIALWTSKPQNDTYNYQGIIRNNQIHYKGSIHEIEHVPVELIRSQFLQKNASHLGTLTLLHLLFSGLKKTSPLLLIQKDQEQTYYFCQKLQNYWQDFFNPHSSNVHIFSSHGEEEKIKILMNSEDSWWQNATQNMNIRKLLIPEFFNTFVRIYLTPWSLIEKLACQTISSRYMPERKSFLDYLEAKIEKFLNEFENLLTLQETIKWKTFIGTQSNQIFQDFLIDYDEFIQVYPIHSSNSVDLEKVGIIGHALNLEIPNLDEWCKGPWLSIFTPEVLNICFDYCINSLKSHWDECHDVSQHPLWEQLDQISSYIPSFSSSLNIPKSPFTELVLFNLIQFKKNHAAKLFLNQNPLFSNFTYPLDLNCQKPNRSTFFIALVSENLDILNYLESLAVCLPEHEMEPLKNLVFECIDKNMPAKFQFILQHHREILHHINQDFMPFQRILEAYCQAHAPHFLQHIPKANTCRYSLFQSSASFSSSSSESDEEIAPSKKVVNFQKKVKLFASKK